MIWCDPNPIFVCDQLCLNAIFISQIVKLNFLRNLKSTNISLYANIIIQSK